MWKPLKKYLLNELIIGLVYSPWGLSKNLILFIFYMTVPKIIWDSCHAPQAISFPDKTFIVPWKSCEENPDPLSSWSFRITEHQGTPGGFLSSTLSFWREENGAVSEEKPVADCWGKDGAKQETAARSSTLQRLCRENKSEINAFIIFVMLFMKVAEFFNIAQTKPLEV